MKKLIGILTVAAVMLFYPLSVFAQSVEASELYSDSERQIVSEETLLLYKTSDIENSNVSPRYAVGRADLTSVKIGRNNYEFNGRVVVTGSPIEKVYTTFDYGDGTTYNTSSHPAGIANFTNLGASNIYLWAGVYYPCTRNTMVYCLSGDVLTTVASWTDVPITIDENFFV